METRCRIEVLGQLRLIREDEVSTRFRTHKIGWMLAYLALHPAQAHARERLIDLFWPDRDLAAGRGNLNNAISSLRRQLEPPGIPAGSVLIADRQSARLNFQVVSTDVEEFDALYERGVKHDNPADQSVLFERAAGLYRGELLPGCYEEWALREQTRTGERYADLLVRWSAALERAGDLEEALSVARRAMDADPYREEAHRLQMRLYAALGQPVAARQAFQNLERFLKAELGVAPSRATREFAERNLREPRGMTSVRAEPSPSASSFQSRPPSSTVRAEAPDRAPSSACAAARISPEIRPALPVQFTRFFGREREKAHLVELLRDATNRLVTLTGPGGAGKTRLSLEVGAEIAPAYEGRVWFVPLADLPDARLLPYSLARALKLPVAGTADPLDPVLARLNEAPSLLVLDNFEHLLREETHPSKSARTLLDNATLLVRLLLERAPHLRCLVTSRRALHLTGEQEFPLPSLPLPDSSRPEDVLASESASLYANRAKLAQPDFAVTTHNAEAVARLCRMLEGMPLAIEMAAAWARALPPARMLERLEERLDALTSRQRDLPARHQSLRATIDWSYDLLTPKQQRLLARLSVFRGGWTLEAVEYICADVEDALQGSEDRAGLFSSIPAPRSPVPLAFGELLDVLTALVDRSLVVREEDGGEARYRFLETVRQYSRDRLKESGETAQIQARHYAFFLKMAEASWDKIKSSEQIHCLNELERELDNMRAALDWSQTEEGRRQGGVEAELDLAGRLRPFWDMRGYWREGRERLQTALARETMVPPMEIRARALLGAGVMAANMGEMSEARTCYEACLAIRQQLGDRQGIGSAALAIGNIVRDAGDYAAAHRWYAQSLEVARALEDTWSIAAVLSNLSVLAYHENDEAAQQRYQEECLMLHRQSGGLNGVAIAQLSLGTLFIRQRNFPAAYAALTESLSLLQTVGNQRVISAGLSTLACAESIQGRATKAVCLWGAVQRIKEETGARPEANYQDDLAAARQELGEEVAAAALAMGHSMSVEQALEYALTTIREASRDTGPEHRNRSGFDADNPCPTRPVSAGF